MPARLANAEVIDSGEIASHVVPAIAETVKKQVEIGIDCINDGEFWTARSLAHYAAHFTGLEARPVKLGKLARPTVDLKSIATHPPLQAATAEC